MDFTKKTIDNTKWGIKTNKITPTRKMRNVHAKIARIKMPMKAAAVSEKEFWKPERYRKRDLKELQLSSIRK